MSNLAALSDFLHLLQWKSYNFKCDIVRFKIWGGHNFLFLKEVYLFDQKSSNIVKYYYNLNYILKRIKIEKKLFIPEFQQPLLQSSVSEIIICWLVFKKTILLFSALKQLCYLYFFVVTTQIFQDKI